MLAPEKCRLIVGRGNGAHYSVLSGKKHQGRTARRQVNRYTARLMVRDADCSIPLLGCPNAIIPPLVDGCPKTYRKRVGCFTSVERY